MSATPDKTFCNKCGIDLTGHDGPDDNRVPCPNCGSLTRKYEVTLAVTGSGGIVAAPAGLDGTGQVVSMPMIDNSPEVFEPTIVVGPMIDRAAVDVHFEHVMKTWRAGDGWLTHVASPNDTTFAGANASLAELLRAAADAIADEID